MKLQNTARNIAVFTALTLIFAAVRPAAAQGNGGTGGGTVFFINRAGNG